MTFLYFYGKGNFHIYGNFFLFSLKHCLIYFTYQPHFPSLLSSHLPPPRLPSNSFPFTPSLSPFRKGQGSHGFEHSRVYQVEAGLSSSPCIKVGQGNPAWGTGSQKPTKCQGQVLIALLEALQTDETTQLPHTC